ncbi:DUF1127 domain-containing protein [Arenibacterium sp. LLYu02]|uniref:DUF1127 domain-containing protein n=1 Tax=Arenibacterium sp. LLYu02 TaxID=3404132 RepID=UPI003B21690D
MPVSRLPALTSLTPPVAASSGSILRQWWVRAAMRRQMARELLTAPKEALADLGITRAEVLAEIAKPFWRA